MADVYLISDLHLGHKWMAHHRGFQDEFYMNEHIIEKWNKVVGKRDIVYVLGDLTMNSDKYYYELDRLKGKKRVVMGNHDNYKDVHKLLEYVEYVGGAIKYKGNILTHIPIVDEEAKMFRYNIHGHVHEHTLDSQLHINVSAEAIGYTPRSLPYLIEQHQVKYGIRAR